MPAKSKKQQRFFGMVHARQKGKDVGGPEVEKVAKDIDYEDADDFASTKHKGLPEKKEKKDEHSLWEQWKSKKHKCKSCDDGCGDDCKCRKVDGGNETSNRRKESAFPKVQKEIRCHS